MAKKDKNQKLALGILTLVGGAEHVAQAMGNTLLSLPLIESAPLLVQGLAGVAGAVVGYQLLTKK